jgi:hypothetical protein
MTASGSPVIHVETHLASVCRGGRAVVIRTDDDMKQSVTLLRRAQEGEIAVSRSARGRAASLSLRGPVASHGERAGAGALPERLRMDALRRN